MPTIKIRKYNDSVYIVYSHKLKIFKIYTGVRIEDNYWYDHAPRKNCPKYDEVTRQIAGMESRILNASIAVRSQGLDPAVDLVRKEFYNQVTEGQERLPFWKTYMIYLGLLTCRTSTQKMIRSTYNTFEKFCKFSRYEFDVDTFDRIVFGQFIKYQLDNQKYADATILKHVKQLKAFLKYAYPEKDWSFVRYSQLKVSHEVIALSEEELGVIMHADVSGHLDKTRDLFVFLALTGMRFCDSQRFHLSWITPENILEFNQLKTGGKA